MASEMAFHHKRYRHGRNPSVETPTSSTEPSSTSRTEPVSPPIPPPKQPQTSSHSSSSRLSSSQIPSSGSGSSIPASAPLVSPTTTAGFVTPTPSATAAEANSVTTDTISWTFNDTKLLLAVLLPGCVILAIAGCIGWKLGRRRRRQPAFTSFDVHDDASSFAADRPVPSQAPNSAASSIFSPDEKPEGQTRMVPRRRGSPLPSPTIPLPEIPATPTSISGVSIASDVPLIGPAPKTRQFSSAVSSSPGSESVESLPPARVHSPVPKKAQNLRDAKARVRFAGEELEEEDERRPSMSTRAPSFVTIDPTPRAHLHPPLTPPPHYSRPLPKIPVPPLPRLILESEKQMIGKAVAC